MTSLPQEFLDRMRALLKDEYEDFVKEFSKEKHQGLRINTLKSDADTVKSEFSLRRIPWCESGYYYEEDERPGKSVLHEGGAFYIQEPSAMAVAENLDIREGETVLDLCSAPGGKAGQIACKLGGKGLLIANEIIPSRAKILSQNIERMGIRNCVVTNESPQRLAERYIGIFDKILVDAPCSGEGMFRKNPLAIEEWSLTNVDICRQRQLDILDCAVRMLKEGGRIVYSTCTFSQEEDEYVVDEFLKRYGDFKVAPSVYRFDKGIEFEGCENRAQIALTNRIFPHKVEGEGHFFAVLQHQGEKIQRRYSLQSQKIDQKAKKECETWQKQNLNTVFPADITFGQNIYSLPDGTPDFDRIRIERAGLCLGELKKDRFEPSHALAMALRPCEVKNVLEVDRQDAVRYIAGEMLGCDIRGWALVVYKGVSLGWCKCDGVYAKNHYPKGLRKTL